MKNIKISVVVPTFNRANLLVELFECLLEQTFSDFEVIISDDGSNDNTKEVVNQYSSKLNILYIYNENWGGPARPRNLGIKSANSDWICFLDSDDLWRKEKLEEMYKIIVNDNYDIIYHAFCCRIGSKSNIIGKPLTISFISMFGKLLYEGNHFVNSSLCIRKEKLNQVGYLSEDKNIIGVEDYDLLLKLAKEKAKFYYINKVLGEYRLNDDNISQNIDSQISKIEIVLSKYVKKENKSKVEALVNYYKANSAFNKKLFHEAFELYYSVIVSNSNFSLKLKSFYKICMLVAKRNA